MMKRLLSLGAAALAALLGGCGDGPSTVPGGYRSPATWSSFFAATSSGPLLLVVHGNPFALPAPELRAKVARAMEGAIPARPFTLTPAAESAPLPHIRVVVALGAPASLNAADLCVGKAVVAGAKAEGGRIEVLAAFCDGSALLSSVRGWV
ncbi:MAG: hypothetical protein HY055_10630, partial [Magnetospirillum sp.]|nr:hypothetical protein [Magnetospirillum sp.]